MAEVRCDQGNERAEQPRAQGYEHYVSGTVVVVGITRKRYGAITQPGGIGFDGAIGVLKELQFIPRFAILPDRENPDP